MKFCTTCGSPGPLESHHVAGRKYSTVTTYLCRPCHFYCSIAGVYERRWRDNEPVVARLWAGVMDIWDRFAECNGLAVTATGVLNDAEYRGIFAYRPCSAVAPYVEQKSAGTWPGQAKEFLRLVEEIKSYAYQS